MRKIKPIRNLNYLSSGNSILDFIENMRSCGFSVDQLDENFFNRAWGHSPKGNVYGFSDKWVLGLIFDENNDVDSHPYFSDTIVFDVKGFSTKLRHYRFKFRIPKNEKEFRQFVSKIRTLRFSRKNLEY